MNKYILKGYGVLGVASFCLFLAMPASAGDPDTDSDGVPDSTDNCILVANPTQLDTNGDGFGNFCDADFDNDCIVTLGAECESDFFAIECQDSGTDGATMFIAFFSAPGSGNWNPDADLDGSLLVNFFDLQILTNSDGLPPGPSAQSTCGVCGDSLPDGGEQCDDGNLVNGDGCDATCQIEAGSDCTAAIAGIPPTPSACLVGDCGDGIASDGEACDDGNTNAADGCSAVCTIEAGFSCTAATPALDVLFGSDIVPSDCTLLVVDSDGDGVPDPNDNCPLVFNTDQADNDSDDIGDVCDDDDDNDTVVDTVDNCPLDENTDQADNDSDNIGDVCDPDDDNDTVLDDDDNCPIDANEDQANFDGDSEGDVCDADDDNDTVLDDADLCPSTAMPDGAPSRRLGKNKWTFVGDDGANFTQAAPQAGSVFQFTTEDTGGCSCEQIVAATGAGKAHLKNGCSTSLMLNWVDSL